MTGIKDVSSGSGVRSQQRRLRDARYCFSAAREYLNTQGLRPRGASGIRYCQVCARDLKMRGRQMLLNRVD